MSEFRLPVFLAFAMFLTFWVSPARGDSKETPVAGIILLLTPTLTLQEAEQLPRISVLLQTGTSALASSRIGRWQGAVFAPFQPEPLTAAYYTMASGSPSAAGREGAIILEAGEPGIWGQARDVWETFSGRNPIAEAYAPFVGLLDRIASAAPYPTHPGRLGDLLAERGIQACVIGNADTGETASREAGLFVVKSSGEILKASLADSLTIENPEYPFGLRTDTTAVLREVKQRLQDTRFIVVESGDLLRFARAEATFTAQGRLAMRERVLARVDVLAGQLADALPAGWRLVLVSPAGPRGSEAAADRLVPVISYQKGLESGLLVSSSTRRPGVLVNTDVASTLATWLLGEETLVGTGRPARSYAYENPASRLKVLYRQADYQGRSRQAVYAMVYGMSALLGAGALLLAGRRKETHARALVTSAAAMPLGILACTPLMPPAGHLSAAALLAAALAGFAALRTRDSVWLAVATAICVPAALMAGWMNWAAASYEVQGGARFYGLGNEYGGTFIGAAVFLAASLAIKGRWKQGAWVAALVAMLAVVFTGHPSMGANAGITAAGILACLVLALGYMGVRNTAALGGAIAGVVVLLFAAGMLDSLRPEEKQSHFGRAIHRIAEAGPAAGWEVAVRKVTVNWMLVRNSPWSVLLATGAFSALVMGYVYGRTGNTNYRECVTSRKYRIRKAAMWVVFLALFLLNDSGVLAAAAAGPWLCLASLVPGKG